MSVFRPHQLTLRWCGRYIGYWWVIGGSLSLSAAAQLHRYAAKIAG
jgi:hypothetical protein